MNFAKTFFAALLAFVVGNIVIMVFGVLIMVTVIAALGSGTKVQAPSLRHNSVLMIDLRDGITDSPSGAAFVSEGLMGGIRLNNSNTILQSVTAIERAASDKNIKGAYINVTYGGGISLANREELRRALDDFRRSGKFVISYGDSYSQLDYYLSSVADRVYINPEGDIDWSGLASGVMFYKGLLDKLDIRAEILRHGSFKAAVEPFMLDRMSPENREQTGVMLESIWGSILDEVSTSRGIDSLVLSAYASALTIDSPETAYEVGMIDGLLYEDQVVDMLGRLASGLETIESEEYVPDDEFDGEAEELGRRGDDDWVEVIEEGEPVEVEELTEIPYLSAGVDYATDSARHESYVVGDVYDESDVTKVEDIYGDFFHVAGSKSPKPNLISLSDYVRIAESGYSGRSSAKNKIAVIYADGDIIDGESRGGSVGGKTLSEKFAEAREDESVKAIVFRVNSPGGSALASEVIWREVELTHQVKPVVVSMGGMAASGGYYISCPADVILADRATLTGSIGVFGLYFDIGQALSKNLGITVDFVKTNPSADLGSGYRPMSAYERKFLMKQVESTYATFVEHVADGRNLSVEQVDAIGGGRVWSGVNARANGLIDGYGGIVDAIRLAADRAGVSDNYRVWQVVDSPDNISAIMRTLLSSENAGMQTELGKAWKHYEAVTGILQTEGVQARMLYDMEIR